MNPSNGRAFDHVLIIAFENEYRAYVMKNPFMRELATKGIELANHFGNMHPSQTNYISSIAGELCNITYDWPPYPPLLQQRTIVDLLEEAPKPLRWKAYLESNVKLPWRDDMKPSDFAVPFPVPDQLWQTTPQPFKSLPQPPYPYAYFHNPFFAFESILRNKARWERLENEAAFWRDLLVGDFPEFAWFSPNLWNDGHYLDGTCEEPSDRAPLVEQQAKWLQSFFATLRFPGPNSRLPPRTLVIVTYDESDFDAAYSHGVVGDDSTATYDGPNQIYTVLLGDMIKPGVVTEGSNHYSMLKTIEKNFDLPSLGKNDIDSNWWQFLWDREFRWNHLVETPIEAKGAVASAALNDVLFVVYTDESGAAKYRTWTKQRWSDEGDIDIVTTGGLALVVHDSGLLLVYRNQGSGLSLVGYSPASGWSSHDTVLVAVSVRAFALAALEFDGTAMLAYADETGALHSLALTAAGWESPVAIGRTTDGRMALAALGPSLFLIYKACGTDQMNVISYNTAEFNVVTVKGGASDTTRNRWSPSEYPVASFWRGGPTRSYDDTNPRQQLFAGAAPFAASCLHGVIHLAHPLPSASQVVTETLSLSGILTPKNPIAAREASTSQAARRPRRSLFSIWAPFLDETDAVKDPRAYADVLRNLHMREGHGTGEVDDTSSAETSHDEEEGGGAPTSNSNGYGTLAEAGWSQQVPVPQVHNHHAGGLAMTRVGTQLVMLSQPKPGDRLRLSVGGFARRG